VREFTERDLTTLSYLMSSLVASPMAADRMIAFYLGRPLSKTQRDVAEAVRDALAHVRTRGTKDPHKALRDAANDLIKSDHRALVAAGRMLFGAFENVRQDASLPAMPNSAP
jgi:hypothetical protein